MEQFWIDVLKQTGHPLTNKTDGGPGVSGLRHTKETKILLSQKTIAQMANPELKEKMHKGQLEYWAKPENKEKQSIAQKNRFTKLEERIKNSLVRGCGPFQDQFGRVYNLQQEATEALGIPKDRISEVLNKKRPQYKGYVFAYLCEGIEPPTLPPPIVIVKRKSGKKIIDQNNVIYISIAEVVRRFNISIYSLYQVLNKEKEHVEGHYFKYIDGE